jgi:hypothetical protein
MRIPLSNNDNDNGTGAAAAAVADATDDDGENESNKRQHGQPNDVSSDNGNDDLPNETIQTIRDMNLHQWYRLVEDLLQGNGFVEPNDDMYPIEILPWLYISNLAGIERLIQQQQESDDETTTNNNNNNQFGITHIMTLNAMTPPSYAMEFSYTIQSHGLDHTYIPTYDQIGYPLLQKHWKTECYPVLKQIHDQYYSGSDHTSSSSCIRSASASEEEAEAGDQLSPRSKIVVHCIQGQNRSGLVVACALLALSDGSGCGDGDEKNGCGDDDDEDGEEEGDAETHTHNWTLLKVLKYLQHKRPGILATNSSFQHQLVDFAASLDLIDVD